MTEEQIINWMRDKVKTDGFKTAADLARQFLNEHDIHHAYQPEFSKTLDASFKVAEEVYGGFSVN